MNTNKKSKFLTLNLVLFLFVGNQSLAQATSQSVCINKKTGKIRISEECTKDESRGTSTITPPKLSKVQQLQKRIADYEAQLLSFENSRKELIENTSKVFSVPNSLESFQKVANDCRATPEANGCSVFLGGVYSLFINTEKPYLTLIKVLKKTQLQLDIELNGYKTINCKKGSEVLKITDTKPKCPKGYK